jgi:uncharacterized protein
LFPRIRIRELKPLSLEGGYLIDGFLSVGFSSAIATESIVHTSQFELVGIIDSPSFPPISIVKDGKPNYPTRIFVNEDLKVGVFLSYLTLDQSLHKAAAKTMLKLAEKYKIGLIVSSVAVKSQDGSEEVRGIGNSDSAREKIRAAGLEVLDHGTIPGIPARLLNEGSMLGQDVIVIIFYTDGKGPDFKSSVQICDAISKLIPGVSCDIPVLEKQAKKAEIIMKETEKESKQLKDSMYR